MLLVWLGHRAEVIVYFAEFISMIVVKVVSFIALSFLLLVLIMKSKHKKSFWIWVIIILEMGYKIIKRLLLLFKSDKLFLYFITPHFHDIFILFIIFCVVPVIARPLLMQSFRALNYFGFCINCCNWFDVGVGNSIIGKIILIVLFSLAFFTLCVAITWIRYIDTFIWIRVCT